MKQFIVLAAILPLLLFFMLQFPFEEARHMRLIGLEERIHNFKIEVSSNPENALIAAEELRTAASEIYDISPHDVGISLEKEGDTVYNYSVEIGTYSHPEAIRLIGGAPKQGRIIVSGKIVCYREPAPS